MCTAIVVSMDKRGVRINKIYMCTGIKGSSINVQLHDMYTVCKGTFTYCDRKVRW